MVLVSNGVELRTPLASVSLPSLKAFTSIVSLQFSAALQSRCITMLILKKVKQGLEK
jgi:hypothetical protein